MADVKYRLGKIGLATGIDLTDTAKIKIMLVTTSYVGTADALDSMATATAGEIVSGGGYTTGGVLLTGNAVTGTGDNAKFDADNYTWSSSTITAGGAVLYHDDTADTPIYLFDFGEDKISSNGDFTINWNINGLMILT